jgi:omega-6 fatty acid desaturase (delta-12 desaturase)
VILWPHDLSLNGDARETTTMTEPRTGRALIDATRPFARDNPRESWWHVGSTFTLLALAFIIAAQPLPWWGRLAASVLAGLLCVRAFILYHDYLHGSILRRSRLARWLFTAFGQFILTPKTVWKQTHNYHHAHTAKIVGSHVGSYMMLTVDMWRQATPGQRLLYRVIRHPLTVGLGYLTIFLYGMCISSFRRNPRKNWDSLTALVLHVGLSVALVRLGGWDVYLFGLLLPLVIAFALGAYLFYAQHNFPEIRLQPRHRWEYTRAALESSSYLKMGPVMQWFTGNIGYHHVHHLNPCIPFYRLPEAMAAIPELQDPPTITLHPRDVMACFALKLWDPEQERMVPFPKGLQEHPLPARG